MTFNRGWEPIVPARFLLSASKMNYSWVCHWLLTRNYIFMWAPAMKHLCMRDQAMNWTYWKTTLPATGMLPTNIQEQLTQLHWTHLTFLDGWFYVLESLNEASVGFLWREDYKRWRFVWLAENIFECVSLQDSSSLSVFCFQNTSDKLALSGLFSREPSTVNTGRWQCPQWMAEQQVNQWLYWCSQDHFFSTQSATHQCTSELTWTSRVNPLGTEYTRSQEP